MRFVAGLSAILSLSSTALATCYFPNGDVSPSDTACNPNALVSHCCFDNQACLSNKLCVSDPHDSGKARFHRGTCTDKAWKSGNCPRECLDTDNNGAPVYSCNSTTVDSYCCYDDCECEDPFEVFSSDQKPADVYTMTIVLESFTKTQTQTNTSTSSSTAAPTSSASVFTGTPSTSMPTSTTASATAAATSHSKGGSTNPVALGIGLGLGLGVGIPAILAIAFFLWRRKDGHKPTNGTAGKPSELSNEEYWPPQEKYTYNHESEVEGDLAASELPASNDPIELPSPTYATPNTGKYN